MKLLRVGSTLALMLATGCGTLLGLDDFSDAPAASATTGSGGEAGIGGDGGVTTTTTVAGGGGQGGSGGPSSAGGTGGGTFCAPQSTKPCYTGPANTEGHGICIPGLQTCLGDGSAYGPCVGDVLPEASDDCATPGDENCDGVANDGCPCAPNDTQACYTGPPATQGVGPCHGGVQTCDAQGTMWGPCVGEQTPLPETCNTAWDDDCNGQTNEGGVGCVCPPNGSQSCYSGPNGTQGVGICAAGAQTCNAQGTAWGACQGEVLPGVESCVGNVDEDCDGSACGVAKWAKIWGDAAADQAAEGVGVDGAGNIYLFGHFGGTIQFGASALISAGNKAPIGNNVIIGHELVRGRMV